MPIHSFTTRFFAMVILVSALSCSKSSSFSLGTHVLFDPGLTKSSSQAQTFFAYPYPSDHRRNDQGMLAFSKFPNPFEVTLLYDYVSYVSKYVDGFSTTAPAYMAFSDAISTRNFPENGDAYLSKTAPLQLVNISSESEDYGKRLPLRFEYAEQAGNYVPKNLLAIAPVWGFPMQENATYALLITDNIRDKKGDALDPPPLLSFVLGIDPDVNKKHIEPQVSDSMLSKLQTLFAPLRSFLEEQKMDKKRIVAATVFTTRSITADLAAIYDQVNEELEAPSMQDENWQELDESGVFHELKTFPWNAYGELVEYYMFEGDYWAPNYQVGSKPYASEGGRLNMSDGVFQPANSEKIHFVLSVPKEPPPQGLCYPLVLVSHGTGGNAKSMIEDGTAGRLAARSLAGIGIDQPLHGSRYTFDQTQAQLYTFNPFNPEVEPAIFRQSAIDIFSLTRFVKNAFVVPEDKSPTEQTICFDTDQLQFFGHSQGAITGNLALPFERHIKSWMLSAGGGGASLSLLKRADPATQLLRQTIINEFIQPAPDELVSDMHPVAMMIQTLLDPMDAINYARHFLVDHTYGSPNNMLLTSGTIDEHVPRACANALALAAQVPMIEPIPIAVPEYEWLSMKTISAPVSNNIEDTTAGFIQWDDNHFPVFTRPEAIHASMHFLQSFAYEGAAVIERDPNSIAR